LIGISSYLLINFWYTRIQANKSGIKALTVNRVGDMFLSVGFFAIFWVFGNVDYATVFSVAPFINESAITIVGLLLLIGAMAKSAQIGLHTWLPDKHAMISYKGLLGYARNFSTVYPQRKNVGKNKSKNRPLSEFLFSFLVGLIVSGRLARRHHFNKSAIETARLQLKLTTTLNIDQNWLDYIHSLLSQYCSNGWTHAKERDNRSGEIYTGARAILVTATLEVFYPLFKLFFLTEHGVGVRALTSTNLAHFNEISLAAFIMSSGFHLAISVTAPLRLKSVYTDGLILPMVPEYSDKECELFRDRLLELGVNTTLTLSRKRVKRAKWLIVIPYSELPKLETMMGNYMIPSKAHLLQVPNTYV
jgi:hypothetical protein